MWVELWKPFFIFLPHLSIIPILILGSFTVCSFISGYSFYMPVFSLFILFMIILMIKNKIKILEGLERRYTIGKNPRMYYNLAFYLILIGVAEFIWYILDHESAIIGFWALFFMMILILLISPMCIPIIVWRWWKKKKGRKYYPRIIYPIWDKFSMFGERRYNLNFNFSDMPSLAIEIKGFDEKLPQYLKKRIKETNILLKKDIDIEKKVRELKTITCPKCKYKNQEYSNYCINCGEKLKLNTCSKCGFENPKNSHYCCNCGTPFRIAKEIIQEN